MTLTPDSAQTVYVTAWNLSGCVTRDRLRITIKRKARCGEGVYAPNAFTPNGDGINERFTVYADLEETDVAQIFQADDFQQVGE